MKTIIIVAQVGMVQREAMSQLAMGLMECGYKAFIIYAHNCPKPIDVFALDHLEVQDTKALLEQLKSIPAASEVFHG